MMSWHLITSAEYAAGVKVEDDFYYLSDTQEVYRGSVSYSRNVTMYDTTLPNPAAKNRLYIERTSLAGYITEDGTTWTQVVFPVVDTIDADSPNPVSGAAVAQYLAQELAKVASSANTIKDATYDDTEHLLTLTKGDDTTKIITLTGLGCSLVAVDNTIQLLDAAGNKIGDPINLDVERFVQGGEYDSTTKEIVLYFDAEKTDSVKIPVGDLVDEYTVESSSTINLTMVANKISAALILSADADNVAEIREDGLYVPKVDTDDLMPKIVGGTAGHIPTIDADGNLVDSGVDASAMGVHKVYQVASEEERAAITDAVEGDFCIVSTNFYDADDAVRTSRTAYVYTNNTWVAFDGNVSAENVYFPADLMTNYAVGKVTLTNGQATVAAAGKNVTDVWKAIFQEYKAPVTTQPSVTVSKPTATVVEVGTTYTPVYLATLNAGKYSYDASTGVTASSWSVTDTLGHTSEANSGQFDSFVVEDSTSYKVTAVATYEAGAIPHANDGTEYPAGQIAAGTKTGTSAAVTGYRAGFYGALSGDNTVEVTSDLIRGLTKTTTAPKTGAVWTIPVPAGTTRVIFAYPATLADATSVKDVNGMEAEIKTAFGTGGVPETIDVEGYGGYTAIPYKVYVYNLVATGSDNTYKVTL